MKMASFAELIAANVEHEPHGRQLQVGWVGHTGALYPITTPTDEIRQHERGGYSPVYIDADDE
jgi:hypothetical protein